MFIVVAAVIWACFSFVAFVHHANEQDAEASATEVRLAQINGYSLLSEYNGLLVNSAVMLNYSGSNPHEAALKKLFLSVEHQAVLNPSTSVETVARFAAAHNMASAVDSLEVIKYVNSLPPSQRPYFGFNGSATGFATLHSPLFDTDSVDTDAAEAAARHTLGLK